VVLFVPPRAVRARRRGALALLPVAAGICVLVVSLLFGTLVGAWAGWRVAVPDAGRASSGALRVPTLPAVPTAPADEAPVGRVAVARAVVEPVPAAQDVEPPALAGVPAVPVTTPAPESREEVPAGPPAVITGEARTPCLASRTTAAPTTAGPATAAPTAPATTPAAPTSSSPPSEPTAGAPPTTETTPARTSTPPQTTAMSGSGDASGPPRTSPRTTVLPTTGARGGHPDGDDRHHHGHRGAGAEDRGQPSASRQPQR
jgi:hypothetical protein